MSGAKFRLSLSDRHLNITSTVIPLLHTMCHQWSSESHLIQPSGIVKQNYLQKVTEQDRDRDIHMKER